MPPKKNSPQSVNVAESTTSVPVVNNVEDKVEKSLPEPFDDTDKFSVVLEKLQNFIKDAKDLVVQVKAIQREHVKLRQTSSKKTKKALVGSETTKRNPSGFAKPTKLSNDLCDFLGVEKGSSMARTMVTKHINEYIKTNSLQDSSDKRQIIPDAKLKSILSVKEGDKLTYFNLQTFIKQHFMKE